MENTKKSPIIKTVVNLPFTKGLYNFFCKSTAKAFSIIMSILTVASEYTTGRNAEILVSCIWIVNHMANKLEGICSISSSVHDNCFCKARRKIKDCICAYCYAHNQQSYQTGLKEHNILNGFIFRNTILPIEALKKLVLIFPYLRIESFGDVQNVIQARNYIRIIKAFPEKRCAIWSKNIAIWAEAFRIEGKPDNTTYVHSSSFLNKPDDINLDKYPFVDHIFTVYTKSYAKKNKIEINCGGRKCIECIMAQKACYFRKTSLFINELKK